MMRLDKFLSECGIGTRSEVKKLIKAKQITVNGEIALKPELKINENEDEIASKGKVVQYQKYHYYMFHKPAGCVTARSDSLHKTVLDYFPEELRKDLSPVGRLDLDTEGLLLFTDDGAWNHHLMSPAHHVDKTYFVKLDKSMPQDAKVRLEHGIDIGDDKETLPAKLNVIAEREAYLTISEGRYHQVKRMFAAIGCEVIYLKRTSIGTLTLEELPVGTFRELTEEEVTLLQQ